jgi:hypothetical protein
MSSQRCARVFFIAWLLAIARVSGIHSLTAPLLEGGRAPKLQSSPDVGTS